MVQLPAQTDVTPGITVFNDRLSIAWRTDFELMIVPAPDPGHPWGQGYALGEYSYFGPALCEFRGSLYIAWTGTDDFASLNVMRSDDGIHFIPATKVVLPENSQYGPALVAGEVMYLAWVGVDPQHQLNVISSEDGHTFLHEDKFILGESSIASPALVIDDRSGQLLLAWTDQQTHPRVGEPRTDGPRGNVTGWVATGNAIQQETFHGPSLVTLVGADGYGARLAFSGTDENHFIYIMFAAEGDPLMNNPGRRQLDDSSPPDGPAMVKLNPADQFTDDESTYYMCYVRGDNHHLNLITFNPFG